MAEFGSSFLLPSDERKINVSVEMLDYDYIGNCTDVKKLRAILETLESGAEGHYPDLQKCAQERLLTLLPDKERVKILRLNHKTTPQEIMDAEADLEMRRKEVLTKDSLLRASTAANSIEATENSKNDHNISSIFSAGDMVHSTVLSAGTKKIPPVRGSSSVPVTSTSGSLGGGGAGAGAGAIVGGGSEEIKKSQRISGYDFKSWEKFDVESACEEVEALTASDSNSTTQKTVDMVAAAAGKRAAAHKREMEQLQSELGANSLSAVQRTTRAAREKLKGNECHKINENEEAFACYSRSLALDPSSSIVYANRAVSCIRLERFELAEDDCTRALEIDNTYVKAWVRRGMARFKRGKYKEAYSDFEEAGLREPSNVEFRNLAENAAAKYLEVEGRHLPSRLKPAAPISISFTNVNASALPLPSASATEITGGKYFLTSAVVQTEESKLQRPGFTRITICEDDGDDSDEESGDGDDNKSVAATSSTNGSVIVGGTFTRVAIVEDDEDDDEDDAAVEQNAIKLKDLGNAYWAANNQEGALKAYTDSLLLSPKLIASLNNRALALIFFKV